MCFSLGATKAEPSSISSSTSEIRQTKQYGGWVVAIALDDGLGPKNG